MGLTPLQHSSNNNGFLCTAYQAGYEKGRLVFAFTCGECNGPFCKVHKVIVIAPGRNYSTSLVQSKQDRLSRIKCASAYDGEQGGLDYPESSKLDLVKPLSPEEFTKDIRSLFFPNEEQDSSRITSQQSVAEQVARIKRQALQGDVHGARKAIEQLFVNHPNDTRVAVEFAHIETRLGNFAQASYLFSEAIYIFEATRNLGYDYVLALQGWASCESKASNSFRARTLFEESLRAAEMLEHSEKITVYGLHAWAILEDKVGNWSRARDLLHRAACIQPGNAVVHQARALMEARAHNYEAARFHFKLAVRSDKNDPKSWQAWALFEASRKCYRRMRRLFYKAFVVDPKDLKTLQAWAHQEALVGTDMSRARARKLYQRCIAISPRNTHTWQSWALLEERSGNIRGARVLYEQGIHINPSSVACLQAYARMERVCGNLDKAKVLLQAARRIDPFNAPALMESALLEKMLGHPAVAEEFFKRARQIDREKSRVKLLRFMSRKNWKQESKKQSSM